MVKLKEPTGRQSTITRADQLNNRKRVDKVADALSTRSKEPPGLNKFKQPFNKDPLKKKTEYKEVDDEVDEVPKEEESVEVQSDLSDVQTWDPTTLPEDFSMIVLGRRRTGKSHLMRHVLKDIKKRFDKAYLFSNTALLEDDYDFIPPENQFQGLDEDALGKIVKKNKELKKKNRQLHELKVGKKQALSDQPYNSKEKENHILIIFDDIIGNPRFRTSPVVKNLYVEGRHYYCSVITLSQEVGGRDGIPKGVRANCDAIVTFFMHSEIDRELIGAQYGSLIEKKQGMEYIKRITAQKHTAAVIDLVNVDAKQYNEYIYKYKAAPSKPSYEIGGLDKDISKKGQDNQEFQYNLAGYSELGDQGYILGGPGRDEDDNIQPIHL